MNKRNLTMVFIGALAAALPAAFTGCENSLFHRGAEFSGLPSEDVPSAGPAEGQAPPVGIREEEFTVTLGIGGGERSVMGPGAGTIRFGSIRNVVQVIVADTTGKIVAFEEVRRESAGVSSQSLSISVPFRASYHFLVLMGHLNCTVVDGNYTYQDTGAPTLLAAGFATAAISGASSLAITMKPVVVDTVFAYGDAEAGAALAGVTLPKGVDAALAWRVMGGFAPLASAQKAAGDSRDELQFTAKQTITKGTAADAALTGVDYNEITTNINTESEEPDGYANFNLTYAPFNLGSAAWSGVSLDAGVFKEESVPVWIVRNGVNDAAQDDDTYFPNPVSSTGGTYPWTGGKNGNGAVVYTVEDWVADLTNLVPAPVTDGTPVTRFTGPWYTGKAAWEKTSDPGTPFTGSFVGGESYTATITLRAAGFAFTGLLPASFKHGSLVAPAISYDPVTGVVTIKFPAAVTAQTVSDVDLTPYLAAPVRGGVPVRYFSAPQYYGTVAWLDESLGPAAGLFEADTSYTATVTLTAAAGWKFQGAPDDVFTHDDALAAADMNPSGPNPTHVAGSGVVKIVFKKTKAAAVVAFSGSSSVVGDSAIDMILAAKQMGDEVVSLKWDGDSEDVVLDAGRDLGAGGLVLDSTNSPAKVVIDGLWEGTRKIALTGTGKGTLITVGNGVTLVLRNITFKGMAANTAPLIRVNSGGTLIMESGARLTGNTANGGGGGVYVSSATFIMNGGTISGNTAAGSNGGGVYVGSNATFIMKNGTISGNTATGGNTAATGLGGGVSMFSSATFLMENGTISGNTAIKGSYGGGYGGGVNCATSTKFRKTGGTICGDNNMDPDDGNPEDNTATSSDSGRGHAVYVDPTKVRDGTAGPGDILDSAKDTAGGGGWD